MVDSDPFCILLIEDDPDTLANVRDILEAHGYRVLVASTFAQAIEGRDWDQVGAILSDRKLPDGVAEEILPHFKQLAPQLPVVVLTGHPDVQAAIAALRQGAYDYLLKPVAPETLLASLRRIVEREKIEHALQDREQRLQAILDTASDAIMTVDDRGIVQSVNPAVERMFGYSPEEVEGQEFWLLVPDAHIEPGAETYSQFQSHLNGSTPDSNHVVTAKRKDGSPLAIDLAISKVDRLGLYTIIIRDVTRCQNLQREVLEIATQQNRRIGQELHDHTQQQLTGVGLLAQCLADRLVQSSPEDAQLAARIAREIQQTAKHVQLLSRGLVPVEVDAEGLRAALTDLALRISELHHVHCEFRCFEPVAVSDNFVATHLYRIAQEAVNNAVKHSHAGKITLSLSATAGNIELTVADDGAGIEQSSEFQPGMGLRIMSYRAGLIGATLRVSRRDRGGTQVECTVWRHPAKSAER